MLLPNCRFCVCVCVWGGEGGFADIDVRSYFSQLAQGEYVAPEKVENILTARCKLIMQIYVHGDSLESALVAVSIPDPETFIPFANAITGSQVIFSDREGLEMLCKHPKVVAEYMKELEKAGRAGGLQGFEFVKRLHLTNDAFSVDNGLLTPTSKVRRPQVRDYFKEHIQAMYEDMSKAAPSAKL